MTMGYMLCLLLAATCAAFVAAQQVTYESCVSDVVFVIDESGSIGQTYYNNLKTYIIDVIRKLAPSERGHHVGAVSFSETTKTQFKFRYSGLESLINSFGYMGQSTNIVGGLDTARTEVLSVTTGQEANRPNVKDIVVLISDGGDNMNTHEEVLEAAANIRNFGGTNNVHVIAIGIGSGVNSAQLEEIATDSTEVHYINSFRPEDLAAAVEDAGQLICRNSQTGYQPPPDGTGNCQAATSQLTLHDPAPVINPNAYEYCHVLVPSETKCQGACGGAAFVMNPSRGELAFDGANIKQSCGCCKPNDMQEHETCALCKRRDGTWIEEIFYYSVITSCSCGDCSNSQINNNNQGNNVLTPPGQQQNTFTYNAPPRRMPDLDLLNAPPQHLSTLDLLIHPHKMDSSYRFNTGRQQSNTRSFGPLFLGYNNNLHGGQTRSGNPVIRVNVTQARAEIIKRLTEQQRAASDAQQELGGTQQDKFMWEECEAEEAVRSLAKPGEFFDPKKVQECVNKVKGVDSGDKHPDVVKDDPKVPVGPPKDGDEANKAEDKGKEAANDE